jgi:hypothetical protein
MISNYFKKERRGGRAGDDLLYSELGGQQSK